MKLDDLPLNQLLDAIAARTPTPGGGAVAAITAALAAALGQMVVNFSTGKKSLAEHSNLHVQSLERLQTMRSASLRLAEDDARAYGRLNELWRLDAADTRRQREFQDALKSAIDPPDRSLDLTVELLDLLNELCGRTNAMLRSDLAIAAVLAQAAARCSAWNVHINLPHLANDNLRNQITESVAARLRHAASVCQDIEESCRV